MSDDKGVREPTGWLSEAAWLAIQGAVPIACVDLLPVRSGQTRHADRVGLIRRLTPFDGEQRWCQVGGRVRLGETVREALMRHLYETLSGVEVDLPLDPQPDYVMQWFPDQAARAADGVPYGYDPRRHAVSLSFCFELAGEPRPVPGGEATDFAWFTHDELEVLGVGAWPGTLDLVKALHGATQPRP
jgi:ADP-ribose pyrophosphatase YjhB (NUDIX family)